MIHATAACLATICTILASTEQAAAGELRINERVDDLNEETAAGELSTLNSATLQDIDTDPVPTLMPAISEWWFARQTKRAWSSFGATASLFLHEKVICSITCRVPPSRKARARPPPHLSRVTKHRPRVPRFAS